MNSEAGVVIVCLNPAKCIRRATGGTRTRAETGLKGLTRNGFSKRIAAKETARGCGESVHNNHDGGI